MFQIRFVSLMQPTATSNLNLQLYQYDTNQILFRMGLTEDFAVQLSLHTLKYKAGVDFKRLKKHIKSVKMHCSLYAIFLCVRQMSMEITTNMKHEKI